MELTKFFLDLIAPKKCYSCKKEWHFICEKCLKEEREFKSICYVCKANSKNFEICKDCKDKVYFDKVIILSHYSSKVISKLIKDWKFYGKKEIFDDFAWHLYNVFLTNQKVKSNKELLIVSVSSHFFRKLKRWYNSSEALCQAFSKISWIKMKKNIVKKVRNTLQQSKLSRKERLKNLENAFIINKRKVKFIKNKHIIILDDVISTGTTLNEISKILKEDWAQSVTWLIIASD